MGLTTEQKIMSAVVQADMFLVSAWKWMLAIIAIAAIVMLAIIHSNRH